MKFASKTIFSLFLVAHVIISYKDLMLIFYIWVTNVIIEVNMQKFNFNNILLQFIDIDKKWF